MPNHNTEGEADLARNDAKVPVENGTGPAELPEVNAAENRTPLGDPGGGAVVDEPDAIEGEQPTAPEDEPAAVGAEEPAPIDQVPAAEADEEELAADLAEPVAGAVVDEPPAPEVEVEGAIEDDETPTEVEEEEPAAAEPPADETEEVGTAGDEEAPTETEEEGLGADVSAPVAAAGAAVDESLAEADEAGASGIEPASAEVDQEGSAADEPSAVEAEEVGATGDEEVPAEADEEELTTDEPPAVEVEEAGATGDEEVPAEADEEELATDEPPAVEVEESGATGDEEAPAEAEEERLSVGAVAPAGAAEAAMDGPPAADVEEGATGDEEAPAEAEEEGLAAGAVAAAAEPLAADVGEAGPTGDEAAPAEASEEGLAAAAPVAAAAAAGAVIDEPPAVEGEEAGEAGGEAPPAEADGAALPAAAAGAATDQDLQDKKRRRLLVGLLALVALLIVAGALFVRYLLSPGPLPDLLPLPVDVNYRPHYLFSIYGIDKPVGVAVSPDGERIYVTEISGEREIKVFDRGGHLLHSFSPPYTGPAERAPVYVAVGPAGRVFVTDRLQRVVFVYDLDGKLLDAILGPDLTLSEYVSKHVDGLQPDSKLAYNLFEQVVRFQAAGEDEQVLPAPDPASWAPLGVRVDEQGMMLLTDVVEGRHAVREFPGELILASTWLEFDPPEIVFGAQGQGSGEFMYPNSAVADSKGRIFVTDGNNGRISVWDAFGSFLFNFGRGVGESALSLPRGAVMDKRDRLHIVDAVDQSVKVYDVSEEEPRFLYAFGDWGTKEGEFNYPGDIALDGTGRLYIADRENNRIQVWSY